jgi:hypothetical protein
MAVSDADDFDSLQVDAVHEDIGESRQPVATSAQSVFGTRGGRILNCPAATFQFRNKGTSAFGRLRVIEFKASSASARAAG